MTRLAAAVIVCALALAGAEAHAQAGAAPPSPDRNREHASQPAAHAPTADDICRALERDAAENALPVTFFARVIWQESRFNAQAVSSKGAEGIAQFMPRTADWRGLADPFDPIEALKNSAGYLHELKVRFGNLGLAAAAYNAGPGRVGAWLASRRALPEETRNYVSVITGWPADAWASPSPPQTADTTIPQGVPCTRLANFILAPLPEQQRIASCVPRWGVRLVAHLSESKAWALYRGIQKRYAKLIGDREPIVLHKRLPGMGRVARYIIVIADDNRTPLDTLCDKLMAAGGACEVLRNRRG
ncbi:MAG: lytic transglycosylase domain-containing protein [Hyphomicrobiales bacterium]|nr:lytic transglycosylase domain-containing protein [Hyphomicrobiales bacterium]